MINYDLPNENEYYTHRIGRTGRAKHGVSFTMTYQERPHGEILRYIKTSPTPFSDVDGILRTGRGKPSSSISEGGGGGN